MEPQENKNDFMNDYSAEETASPSKGFSGKVILYPVLVLLLFGIGFGIYSLTSTMSSKNKKSTVQKKEPTDIKSSARLDFIANQLKTGKITISDVQNSLSTEDVKVIKIRAGLVDFQDKNLEQAIRNQINKTSGSLFAQDIAGITTLDASSLSIVNLDGIQLLKNLKELKLDKNQLGDISILGELNSLELLSLSNNRIYAMDDLGSLTRLKKLSLENNYLDDISALKNLKSLEYLNLGGNKIEKAAPLGNLTSLGSLILSDNKIEDISPLSPLGRITQLYLNDNLISDIKPLTNLKNLMDLNLEDNDIKAVSSLSTLARLEKLSLHDNGIVDISPLNGLRGLKSLKVSRNPIRDYTPVEALSIPELIK